MPDQPTLTSHNDGSITVEWPDPQAHEYPVSSDYLQGMIDNHNQHLVRIKQLEADVAYWRNEYRDAERRAECCERAAQFAANEAHRLSQRRHPLY